MHLLVTIMFALVSTLLFICHQSNTCSGTEEHFIGHAWSYKDLNNKWCDMDKKHSCCGKKQSPIALNSNQSTIVDMKPFVFSFYSLTNETFKTNINGHTVSVHFDKLHPKIEGGGLHSSYKLHSLHMHWGSTDHVGSEHMVDGKHSSLELHLVHFNSKFKKLSEAIHSDEPDAVAVLAVLYEVDNTKKSPALHYIASKLPPIELEKHTTVETFELRKLLPNSVNHFFRYSGSLTTPTCSEVVVWTVFKEPNYVSEHDLKKFRNIKQNNKGDVIIVNNFRKIQELNGRHVISGVIHHK